MSALAAWEVVAQNLPEHARNAIHTDEGARAAGFPRALVAGVTTYAYLTHPAMVAWGLDWVAHGGGEVRFRRPVFDGDLVRCRPDTVRHETVRPDTDPPDTARQDGDERDGDVVLAVTDEPDQPRAELRVTAPDRAAADRIPVMRDGEPLAVREIRLDGEWGADYGLRCGDPLPLCPEARVVHPAVWPALANHMVHAQVARGPWIHTRSIVRHHALAPAGSIATVRATVVNRFAAHGERAVLDVQIAVDGTVVATLEHEAIVALP